MTQGGSEGSATRGSAQVSSSLQLAIDRTLMRIPQSSPGGVTVRWASDGRVSFAASSSRSTGNNGTGNNGTGNPGTADDQTQHARAGEFGLAPWTLGRLGAVTMHLSPGGFVFHPRATTEVLGYGLGASYRVTASGVEQLFTLKRRPAGVKGEVVISQHISGSLRPELAASGQITFRDGSKRVLTYTGLKVTDAHGVVVPSRLALVGDSLEIRIQDAKASYPLTIDPTVIAAPAPVATLTAPSTGTQLMGFSIAISADGQTAAVGVPRLDEVLVYTASGMSWSDTPAATLTASGASEVGYSVAISGDGRTIAAGAPFTNFSKGEAVVWTDQPKCTISTCGWFWPSSPTATLTDSGASSGESFGGAVTVSEDGHTVVAGAPGANSNAGEAFVYADSGSGWSNTPTTTFTGTGSDALGMSVATAADGQTIVVGAPGASSGAGEALLYTNPGSGWSNTPTATLTASGSSALGTSVAIAADGHTVVSGAPSDSSNAGGVYLYSNSGSGWSSSPSSSFTGSAGEEFGGAVAVSADGETLTIGAPAWNSNAGEVLVYSKASGTWPIQPTDTYTGSGGEQLGHSVSSSADGQTLGAGAPDASSNAGLAQIYATAIPAFAPSPTWSTNGAGSGDELGDAVAISADGHTAVVGEPGVTGSDSTAFDGEVLIFKESNGSWSTTPTQTYTGTGGEFLGAAVAVSADGQTVVAGASRAGGSNQGAALVYQQSGGSWPSSATKTFTGATAGDLLGASVGISGDGETVVAGEPGAGTLAVGAVLVYAESGGSWSNTPSSSTLTYSGSSDLGDAVAISGDGRTIVAGAPGTSGAVWSGPTEANVGQVDIYSESGGTWSGSSSLTTDVVAELGASVAISANGDEIAAGGPLANYSDPTGTGGAGDGMVMSISYEPYSQTQTGYVDSADFSNTAGDELGASVAVSADGHTIAAGSPGADGGDGAVAVFTGISSAIPGSVPTTFQGATSADGLGGALALSGDGETVLVGSRVANGDVGNASLYTLLNATVTSASSVTLGYSSSARSVPLAATLSSGGSPVSGATVDFSVEDSNGDTVGTPVSATTSGSGVASASFTLPAGTAAGSYKIQAMYAGDGQSYAASSDDTQTLTIDKATQTVGFTSATPTTAVVGGTYTVAGAATSGLAVTFEVDSGVTTNGACTVSGSTVSFIHAGTCGIDAQQAGDSNYDSASAPAPQMIAVGQASQSIAYTSGPPSNATVGGGPYTVIAAGGASGEPVTFTVAPATTNGACTIAGSTVSFVHVGTCVIAADQAGDSDYTAAVTVNQSFAVRQAAQTLTFTSTAPSNATVGGSPYTVAARGGASGEPVTFSVAPATTNGACTIAGSTVSFVASGTCVIAANQAGDSDYTPAAMVTQTIAVAAAGSPSSGGSTSTTQCAASAIRGSLARMLAGLGGRAAKTTSISHAGGISLTFKAPCAGRIVVDWHSTIRVKKRTIRVLIAAGSAGVASSGPATVKVRLTTYGRKLLRAARSLKVDELGTFTPTGSSRTTDRRTVTLRR